MFYSLNRIERNPNTGHYFVWLDGSYSINYEFDEIDELVDFIHRSVRQIKPKTSESYGWEG